MLWYVEGPILLGFQFRPRREPSISAFSMLAGAKNDLYISLKQNMRSFFLVPFIANAQGSNELWRKKFQGGQLCYAGNACAESFFD